MLEKDYDIIQKSLNNIGQRHSFDEEKDFINPYKSKNKAQTKCTHMFQNDTDAIYTGPRGIRTCAICGKKF